MTPIERRDLFRRVVRALIVFAALAGALVLGFVLVLVFADKALAEPVDKIAAIVEDQVILKSEVDEQTAVYVQQQNIAEGDTAAVHALWNEVLDKMIDEKVVLAEAKKQNLTIPDTELDQAVTQAIDDTKQRIGSEQQFNLELQREGLTLDQLRERYRGEVQKQMLQSRLVGKEIRSKIEVTDQDVDAYFEKHRAELPKKPEQVHVRHILIQPKADPAEEKAAFEKAASAKARIAAGEDFAKVAGEVSQDASAKYGGDIGRVQKGELEAAFDSVAFTLPVGAVSDPVRTSQGYHVIRVDERNGDEARVRHIIVPVATGEKQMKMAQALANDVLERARKGEPFEDLARRYSDEMDVRQSGGDLGNLPVKALREPYLSAIQSLQPGGITDVLQDERGFHIFQLIERIPEQDYTLDEVRKELQQMAYQEKMQAAYEEWVSGLRKNYYVEKRSS